MIKPVLTFLSDMVLVVVVLIIMGAGIMGARLPYRQPAINSGAYQLEAFSSGLAWYQYGRVSPFYSVSPLNDYIVASESGRIALVSKDAFEQKQVILSLDQPKQYRLWETVMAYAGFSLPHYWITAEGTTIAYASTIDAAGTVVISRSVTFNKPRWIEAQVMTLSYNASDSVDLKEGTVTVSNPSVFGKLTLTSSLNQTVVVDKKTQLIEVRSPVNKMTGQLVISIKMRGLPVEEK